jgi:hypothetical protein
VRTTARWWLVATTAVVASHVTALVLGGFGSLGLLLLLGTVADAAGLRLGHAGPFLLLGVSIPVLAVLMSVPAMLVVRLFRGAHPVLGPFAAACAGLPVVTVAGGLADSFPVGVLVGGVVEVAVLRLLVRPELPVAAVPVPGVGT